MSWGNPQIYKGESIIKRKGFTRLLSCALLLSVLLGVLVFPASAATQFVDVYPGMLSREYFDAINYIVDNGIMNGTDTTHFSPYQNITRGMFVTILYRYSESKERIPSSFSDVPSSTYYYYPIGWATNKGIVNGVTTTTFNPEGVITKEQMAVMLYRYAKNIDGKTYTTSTFDDLTSHPDYSSVSSYAREAVAWAKTYRVFPLRQNSSSYISATANMNRAYAALYVANYAKNITGFPQRDRFSFINSANTKDHDGDFHSIYVMSSEAQNRLISCINNYYGSSRADTATRDIDTLRSEFIGKEFGGSCLGYTLCTLFDKNGKIDFNKNFGKNSATMNSVGRPYSNAATVESAINYYQSIQYLTDHYSQLTICDTRSNCGSAGNTIYHNYSKYGATPIAIIMQDGLTLTGHEVLVVNVVKSYDSNGYANYDISYIDPNYLNGYVPEHLYLKANEGLSFENKPVVEFWVFTPSTLNWYDGFDLDGNYNSSHYIPVSSSTTAETFNASTTFDTPIDTRTSDNAAQTATLVIPATEFQLINASGDTLIFDGTSLQGSMHVFSKRMILRGLDSPCSLVIDVPKSDYYEYVNLSEANAEFSIITDDSMGSISGSGIHTVIFDAVKNTLSVDGVDVNFSLCLRTNIPQFEYFYLNAQSSHSFAVGVEDSAVTTEGLSGAIDCGYAPPSSLTPETTSLMLFENCSIDFSDAANGYLHIITDDGTVADSTIPITSFVRGELYE